MKTRILTLTPFLWSGAGKSIVRLLCELKARGLDCELVSSGRSRGLSDWPEYVRQLRKAGIPCHAIDLFDRDPARVWQSIGELTDLLGRRRFDLLHAHAGVPAFAALASRDRLAANFPVVATFHSWNPGRPAWMNHADIWALNRCDRVATVSLSYRRVLESWGLDGRRCETIRLGVDLPEPRPPAAHPSRTFRVLSVGRIEPRKDQETLLRGFSLFRRRLPQSELWMVGPAGDENYAGRLMKKAARYGWDRGVRFLGKVRDPSLWYRKADLFVTTSSDEGLGLSLLEAMSHALPALCTLVDGHADFVQDGRNARVISSGNPKALAESLQALHADAALRSRLGERARATVAGMFSWSRTVGSYLELYRALPARSESPGVMRWRRIGNLAVKA